ncbi:hypothetical protein K435DRAFT_786117 [Dendrothele bispora CBS 962.96]|uniref:Uncharacterized protein n=1 Tax=Dendrothele bispora (strain CBS 962.96) TaxID=1314807 RepID=A0A4S8KSF7_DENBC|nr:hypothetical protein K435DRAFT_786117 [Dendrothele bispora CBS 962.96]
MVNTGSFLAALGIFGSAFASDVAIEKRQSGDPCAKVGGQKWVSPSDLRACFTSVPVDPVIKENIIEVINKTLAFHTSVNYQISAPEPFTEDVHEDLLKDLARISGQSYASDFDLHIDLSRTLKRLNDGHCVWINNCYDSLFLNFLPIPLVLLTDNSGAQTVNIAPEAFKVASAEFPDQVDVWQAALPENITLESLNGATVSTLDGKDPWVAINANALITGSFEGFGTRQNAFFSSYQRSTSTWNYIMGNFAQQSLPLSDSVTLEVQRVGQQDTDKITLPYRARIGTATLNFTDTQSWRNLNCKGADTSGFASNSSPDSSTSKTVAKFRQQPPTPAKSLQKQSLNVMLDSTPLTDVVLPPELQPASPPLNGSFGVGQFFMLDDGITGVLALGSFSGADFDTMESSLLEGLLGLKSMGATQLVVDVSNNGGGFICIAHFLHRVLVGPKSTSDPQAGLDTKARAGPLAQMIVKRIIENNTDPNVESLYNPLQWTNASDVPFAANFDWLDPPVRLTINGHPDAFSQRLGQECVPSGFTTTPPDEALFEGSKVVIVNNGRCASSCSLFSITMAKEEGAKTVVLGGKKDVQQEYCGTVGGQSTDFVTISSEIAAAGLSDNPLAPPPLMVNGVQGITWRLGFGIDNPDEPEEWQDHPADLNLPLTPELVNNPVAIWTEVVKRLL